MVIWISADRKEVETELWEVTRRLTAIDLTQRPHSAGEVAQVLEEMERELHDSQTHLSEWEEFLGLVHRMSSASASETDEPTEAV